MNSGFNSGPGVQSVLGPVCAPHTHLRALDHGAIDPRHRQSGVAPGIPQPSGWWNGDTPHPIASMPPPLGHAGDYGRPGWPPNAVGCLPTQSHRKSVSFSALCMDLFTDRQLCRSGW
ncbi:uncharacterized protein EI90DRAFT_3027885 [Cantharellus anzutake]|uniref:uncharacterized protein n=1 Tax=Cantharellus anzutake TaxID=1750568 RepID=UPI001908AC07|nr:uncharacterized protein EI90DRAFT_3027885 [Cantharellus anzutake]KAF8344004.1 hypothetical protein EI90DRAFT_3027885 [Cantharellus anzutake]